MVSEKTKSRIQNIGILLSLIGISCLWQPFTIELYKYGFQILCIGGALYIFIGFVPAGATTRKSLWTILKVCFVLMAFILLGIVLAPILVGA